MRVLLPWAMAAQPWACALVGASKVRSNHALVTAENGARGPGSSRGGETSRTAYLTKFPFAKIASATRPVGGPNVIKPGENLNPAKTLRMRYDAWRQAQPATFK